MLCGVEVVVTFDVDVCHCPPKHPANYVCNSQCLVDNLNTNKT